MFRKIKLLGNWIFDQFIFPLIELFPSRSSTKNEGKQ